MWAQYPSLHVHPLTYSTGVPGPLPRMVYAMRVPSVVTTLRSLGKIECSANGVSVGHGQQLDELAVGITDEHAAADVRVRQHFAAEVRDPCQRRRNVVDAQRDVREPRLVHGPRSGRRV